MMEEPQLNRADTAARQAGRLAASSELLAASVATRVHDAEVSVMQARSAETRELYKSLVSSRRQTVKTLSTHAAILRCSARELDRAAIRRARLR